MVGRTDATAPGSLRGSPARATDSGANEGRRGAAADPKPRRSPRLKRAGAGAGAGRGRVLPSEMSGSAAKNNASNTEVCEEETKYAAWNSVEANLATTRPKKRCRSKNHRINDFVQEKPKEPSASSPTTSQEGCHTKDAFTMSTQGSQSNRVRSMSQKPPPPSPPRELDGVSSSESSSESSSDESSSNEDDDSGGVKDSDDFHVLRSRFTRQHKGKSPKSKRYSQDEMDEQMLEILKKRVAKAQEERLKAQEERLKAREERLKALESLAKAREERLKAEKELNSGPTWSTWMHVDQEFSVLSPQSSTATKAPRASKPQLIEKWDIGAIVNLGNGTENRGEYDCLNDIISRLQKHIGNACTLPYCNGYGSGVETLIGYSEQLIVRFWYSLDLAMRQPFRAAKVPGSDRLRYDASSVVDPSSDTSHKLDFEYSMPRPGQAKTKANITSGICLIVGEVKTTRSLNVDNYEELIELVHEREKNTNDKETNKAIACPVTQLCNYMDIKNCKYGILSNHKVTFFVKKVSSTTVLISESFKPITARDREELDTSSKKGKKPKDDFALGNVAMADKYDGGGINGHPPFSLLQATSVFVAIAMKDFLDSEKEENSAGKAPQMSAARGGTAKRTKRYASSQGGKSSTKSSKSVFDGRLRPRRTRLQDSNAGGAGALLANASTMSPSLFSGQVEIDIETEQHLLTPVLSSVGAGYKSVSVKSLASGEVEQRCFAKALPLHLGMTKSIRGDAERAARQAIDNEAELLLGRAAPLQGKVLPRVIFFGTTTDGLESTYLITRHEGDSLSSRDGSQRALQLGVRKIRRRLHRLLNMLHKAGLAHGDVALRNIVINNDNVLHFIDIGMGSEDPSSQDMEYEHAELDRALDKLEL
ncbi:Hypothetical Protein FCC1311_082592 [Hondaea fermentalgiana]|uniref:Protein kinase domain-containing protein n=1 Tax=Hondaea fermentalgiana TaxID=2315210 RepID=A0A2R5GVT6_9STRA|nr:Hypothetical Protein FCC1311_082592 [Hondaea fermentalgiana]|eukprot:GBG32034.1 Hypothetical Protein FCC1311_082592 [Hondaea fermentalgiana]